MDPSAFLNLESWDGLPGSFPDFKQAMVNRFIRARITTRLNH